MASATIKLFLIHGDAKRLRIAELSNWTGKAVAGPRSELEGILAREEAVKSGVYFLIGTDSESGKSAVYIGEAESIRDRLRSHLDKVFLNHVIFLISKDENLTKAHIRYLEGRLIDQAKSAARSLVMNGQSSGSKLPESDREELSAEEIAEIYRNMEDSGLSHVFCRACSEEMKPEQARKSATTGLIICKPCYMWQRDRCYTGGHRPGSRGLSWVSGQR